MDAFQRDENSRRAGSGAALLRLTVLGLCLPAAAGGGCHLASHGIKGTTPRTCAECHPDITREWTESSHAITWTNPEFAETIREDHLGSDHLGSGRQ